MADPTQDKTGFLRRLLRDERGNAMVIMGVALIPITGMIGSGLDLSRAYMAKSRLQTACDAGALAGRRAMTADQLTPEAQAEARKFFNFNFKQRQYDTAAFTPQITRPTSGTVRVAAATTIPTGVMKMFGNESIDLRVTCEATLNMVNTDIVLVLDVTGSMASSLGGTPKIQSLREAVMAFYDELAPIQTQLQAGGMRLRYSIVPYSANVNVGRLIRAVNSGYLDDLHTYQSRVPIFYTFTRQDVANQTQTECNNRASPKNPGGDAYPATEVRVAWPGSGTRRTCQVYTINYNTTGQGEFSGNYLHVAIPYNVSSYKAGNSVPVPSRKPGTTQMATWAGCIEERDTVKTIRASSGYAFPPNAHDLNIDLLPSSDATRWKPVWPEVSYRRVNEMDDTLAEGDSDGRASAVACPVEAARLRAFTRSDMQSYVNSLQPTGNTYHDIGMIWGARMISNAGVFGDSPNTFNGMPVTKHVVFMTDGELYPQAETYSMYGIERWDQRVAGTFNLAANAMTTGQYESHEQRFRMMCNAVKGRGVSVWSIAFVPAGDPAATSGALAECASNSDQVAVISNRDALIAQFRRMGSQIGALRLHN